MGTEGTKGILRTSFDLHGGFCACVRMCVYIYTHTFHMLDILHIYCMFHMIVILYIDVLFSQLIDNDRVKLSQQTMPFLSMGEAGETMMLVCFLWCL